MIIDEIAIVELVLRVGKLYYLEKEVGDCAMDILMTLFVELYHSSISVACFYMQ